MHPVWSDVPGELPQEGEDVLDGGGVGQPSEPQAVSHTTRRGQERNGGQHGDQGSRGHRDEGGRGVPVQHLQAHADKRYSYTMRRGTHLRAHTNKDTVTHCWAHTRPRANKQTILQWPRPLTCSSAHWLCLFYTLSSLRTHVVDKCLLSTSQLHSLREFSLQQRKIHDILVID